MATKEFGQQMQSNIKKKMGNENTIHPDKKRKDSTLCKLINCT
jgi:hypothetical protein